MWRKAVSSTAHKRNSDSSEMNDVEVVAKVKEYSWRLEVNFKIKRRDGKTKWTDNYKSWLTSL